MGLLARASWQARSEPLVSSEQQQVASVWVEQKAVAFVTRMERSQVSRKQLELDYTTQRVVVKALERRTAVDTAEKTVPV